MLLHKIPQCLTLGFFQYFCCVNMKVWTDCFKRERKNTDFFWSKKVLGKGDDHLTFSVLMGRALISR